MQWIADTLYRLRFAVWLGVAAIAITLFFINRPVQFDQSIDGFFPPDYPALTAYRTAREAFGNDDFVFVAYEDGRLWTPAGMERIGELTGKIRGVPGVVRVDSLDQMPLPWKVDSAVEKLLSQSSLRRALALPAVIAAMTTVEMEAKSAKNEAEIAALKERVTAHPLFRNLLVSQAGDTTALVVQLEPPGRIDQKESVMRLRVVADEFGQSHGLERVAVVGPPVLLADGFISVERDNRRLGTVAMLLMAFAMFVAVRSPWWAVLPLLSGTTTWLVTQAILNGFDLRLTLSAGPIIAQTVVLCMPAASHLAMHYRDAVRRLPADEAARQTLASVAAPVAWCSITAAAGYLALLTSEIRPVYQFGVTMAASNLAAGLLAYALAAGAMRPPRIRRHATRTTNHANNLPATQPRRLGALTAFALNQPGAILAAVLIPAISLMFGISRLQFESNYIRIFRDESRVAQDYQYVEDRMGGIGLIELLVPGPGANDEIDPKWLHELRRFSDKIQAEHDPLVNEAVSLADVLLPGGGKQAGQAADGSAPDRQRGSIADFVGRSGSSRPTAAQIVQMKRTVLDTPGFAHILENFWDRPTRRTRIIIRIRESADAEIKQAAFDSIVAQARQRYGSDCAITGLSHLMTQVTRAIITTQFQSTAWCAAIILIMLILALRSVPLGVMAIVPTALAVAVVLGTMGWLGIKIDLSTALVASVATGLSVDDTFHCLLRWRRELRSGHSRARALEVSYAGTGPGVILSSLAVSIGFLALAFSQFVPTANFGWLVAVATLGGSMGNLVVLPACLAAAEHWSDRSGPPS